MAQHLQRQSIRSPPPSDEKGVALFPLRRFSDNERRREEYFARMERRVAHALEERRERCVRDSFARLADSCELRRHDGRVASFLAPFPVFLRIYPISRAFERSLFRPFPPSHSHGGAGIRWSPADGREGRASVVVAAFAVPGDEIGHAVQSGGDALADGFVD